ncbi:hypothetical protein AB6A40_010296, partial [Gnathostoma spinigerum]
FFSHCPPQYNDILIDIDSLCFESEPPYGEFADKLRMAELGEVIPLDFVFDWEKSEQPPLPISPTQMCFSTKKTDNLEALPEAIAINVSNLQRSEIMSNRDMNKKTLKI